MADLRIVDAPVLLQESITDDVKMPTGGLGNFSVRLGDIVWYVVTKEQLASKNYVDLSSKGVKDSLNAHIADKANPHQVTKEQVGLGSVDNTADVDKPVSNAVRSAIDTATSDMATKAYVNQKDNLKADKATTLSGYGIADAYQKSEVYNKSETYSKIEVYTKNETDININSVSGGYFKAFPTLSALQAATGMLAGQVAKVTNDPDTTKNGDYRYNGYSWILGYSPLQEAKNYTDSYANVKAKSLGNVSLNTYTTSGFYIQSGSSNATTANNYPVQDAGFLRVDTHLASADSSLIYAVQQYYPQAVGTGFYIRKYNFSTKVWSAWDYYDTASNLKAYADSKVAKSYELTITGSAKNLFKKAAIKDGYYLNTSGQLSTASGWGTSGFIPITGGQTYTISGNFGYSGASFFANEIAAINRTTPLLYQAPFSGSVTLTAPANATILVINLYQSSNKNYSNVQVEAGTTATAYENGDDVLLVKKDAIYPSLGQSATPTAYASTVTFAADNTMTVSASDANTSYSHTMQLVKSATTLNSMVANFTSDSVSGTTVSTSTDEVAPVRLDTTIVGANHGYNRGLLNAPSHDKTVADIGSTWVDSSGNDCVLIDVVDANNLYFVRTTTNSSFATSALVFTHKANATNTATINGSTMTAGQWHPSIKALNRRVYVDGNKVDYGVATTLLYNSDVVVAETYEILSRASMVQQHLNNVGKRLTDYESASSVLSVTNNYRFDRHGGITIESEYLVLAQTTLIDIMMLQALMRSFSGTTSYYIPKIKPIVASGTTYNFDNIQQMTGVTLAGDITVTTADIKTGENAPDRVIQINADTGFALGFLPVLDAAYDVRKANTSDKSIFIPASSKKVYPYLLDKGDQVVDIGTVYAGVGYRKYFKRKTGETAVYPVYSRFGDYLYMHWHSAGLKRVELPEKLMGRAFEVSEKSANVTLISKVAGSVITTTTSDSNSAYLVLKFN